MFDNRIATLENTRQVLLCKCTERFARENVNRGGGELEIGLLSQIEFQISNSRFKVSSDYRERFSIGNQKWFPIGNQKSAIGNDESVARELILRSSY